MTSLCTVDGSGMAGAGVWGWAGVGAGAGAAEAGRGRGGTWLGAGAGAGAVSGPFAAQMAVNRRRLAVLPRYQKKDKRGKGRIRRRQGFTQRGGGLWAPFPAAAAGRSRGTVEAVGGGYWRSKMRLGYGNALSLEG